jgi:predicted O-methyltransferase YrrM
MNIKQAFDDAEQLKSKIPAEYIEKLTGLASPKVWHLLNNLAAQAENYLEIGTYMGSSLMAALYDNGHVSAVAVDNFCMKPHTRGHFFKNTDHLKFTFIEQDCFTINPSIFKTGFDLYFYDGRHNYEDQFKALTHFYPAMKNEFVFMVDDWNNGPVKAGTMDAIQYLNLEVVEMVERHHSTMKDKENWWCGVAVFKLKKS